MNLQEKIDKKKQRLFKLKIEEKWIAKTIDKIENEIRLLEVEMNKEE